jgi:hypothetical protein
MKKSAVQLLAAFLLLSLTMPVRAESNSVEVRSAARPVHNCGPPAYRWVVERASDWDALFDRDSGWLAADGIYSIPLTGVDTPGSARHTFFVFGDTLIGKVGSNGQLLSGAFFVNNTAAYLYGSKPLSENFDFFWGFDDQGRPDAVFIPDTPNTNPGNWYWMGDGVIINGFVYMFAARMKEGSGGVFNFALEGVALLKSDPRSPNPLQDYLQADTPLFFVPTDGRGEIMLGSAVMANTAEAGGPFPDGYIYIYGYQSEPYSKKLVVARVLPDEIEDFSRWRYWDGSAWSSSIEDIAPLTGRISSEFSVSPLPDGRFVLVFQRDGMSEYVAVRIGETPVGPFGPVKDIWRCSEVDDDPDIYTYNAKAHPHLSRPGELLISYNVNTFDFWDLFARPDIYRPRFIRIRLVR